jgi:hypothetical protein
MERVGEKKIKRLQSSDTAFLYAARTGGGTFHTRQCQLKSVSVQKKTGITLGKSF